MEIERAILRPKGNYFEDFEIGRIFNHHWGRTLTQAENAIFSSITMNYNPAYFNRIYAEALGHRDIQVNPMLVFDMVFGMSVEDLSEAGVAFLGVNELVFHKDVYPNDTLTCASEVVGARLSNKDPSTGIVTWRTTGWNQDGEKVIEFLRSNLVNVKAAQ